MTAQSNARMEAELTRWLRGLEPAGTPISLRMRISADLRREAERPIQAHAGLRLAMSSIASLAAVVAGAGLVVLLAVAESTLSGAGASGPSGQIGSQPGGSSGYSDVPPGLLFLVACSVLAGLAVWLRPLQRQIGRLVAGMHLEAPAEPVRPKRAVRAIPRLTWGLGAIAVVMAIWSVFLYPPAALTDVAIPILSSSAGVLALAIALRYPGGDRSGRLLMVGAVAFAIAWLAFLCTAHLTLGWVATAVEVSLTAAGSIALGAGLAVRSGSVRRPPRLLASVVMALAFLLTMPYLFLSYPDTVSLLDQVAFVVSQVAWWLIVVAWLAIIWVGLRTGLRRRGTWAWRLVFVAGLLYFLSNDVFIHTNLDVMGNSGLAANTNVVWWTIGARFPAIAALVVALLFGLKPVLQGSSK
jgi:hypothetical protein